MRGIPTDADLQIYCNCMEEIKRRTDAASAVLRGPYTTLYRITNLECVCLQVRKVLELIALASMAAHKDEYARQHEKFAKEWRAKRILKELETLNPGFYPVPSEQVFAPGSDQILEVRPIQKPYLTKQDFMVAYQKCSSIIHATNPYGEPVGIVDVEASIPTWIEKIKSLLTHHQVQLYHSRYQLWVVMNAKQDGRVHAHLMGQIDDSARVAELDRRRAALGTNASQ